MFIDLIERDKNMFGCGYYVMHFKYILYNKKAIFALNSDG